MLSEVEQQEQQRSDWSSGREWESQRKTLRALDVLISDVPHLLIRTPPASAIFSRHFLSLGIPRVNSHDSGGGCASADHTPPVCLFSLQQSRDEQTITAPCQGEGEYHRLKQEIQALIVDEKQRMSSSHTPDRWQLSGPWRVMRVRGPLEHHLIGVMQSLATSFVRSGSSIMALSSWDTDYVLVQEGQYGRAVEGLKRDGWVISS